MISVLKIPPFIHKSRVLSRELSKLTNGEKWTTIFRIEVLLSSSRKRADCTNRFHWFLLLFFGSWMEIYFKKLLLMRLLFLMTACEFGCRLLLNSWTLNITLYWICLLIKVKKRNRCLHWIFSHSVFCYLVIKNCKIL